MLEMRQFCECCGADLPTDAVDALICSFECTFCRDCAEQVLGKICPNCGGDLTARPTRATRLLIKYPALAVRIVREAGCPQSEA